MLSDLLMVDSHGFTHILILVLRPRQEWRPGMARLWNLHSKIQQAFMKISLSMFVTFDRTEIYCPGFPVITVEDEARLYETCPVADLLRVALLT
jgi:hypothetical protein